MTVLPGANGFGKLLSAVLASRIITLGLFFTFVLSTVLAQTKIRPSIAQASPPETVRTVDFCDLIKQPYGFRNQTVRIKAKWEFAGESGFLEGFHCRGDYIERLGTTFAKEQDEAVKWNVSRVRSPEFGARAMITVMGAVRDTSPGDGPSALRFEILRFEDIAQLESIPDVDFCDLVKEPAKFFNHTVRIKASWLQGDEFSYVEGVNCPTKFRSEIAVGWVNGRDPAIVAAVEKILSREYGARANITAVGTLRDPGRSFGYYRYQFQILRIEDVQHVVTSYDGTVEAGHTYRAVVRGDKNTELSLLPPLHIERHYSVGVDWINLSDFPALEKLHQTHSERTIVFSVLSDVRRQMTDWRWSRMLEIKIVRVE